MKNIVLVLSLLVYLSARSQSLCLQTMCTAAHANVGDTVLMGAVLTAANLYQSVTYSQTSGPNTATLITMPAVYVGSVQAQQNIKVTGLAVGTYLFKVVGTDQKGAAITGVDSIVVAASTPCPPVPGPPTFSGVTVTIFGVPITIPAGQGTKITFTYNNVTQTITF
jgi:hypothetical protein